jgi:hypothetical protein
MRGNINEEDNYAMRIAVMTMTTEKPGSLEGRQNFLPTR